MRPGSGVYRRSTLLLALHAQQLTGQDAGSAMAALVVEAADLAHQLVAIARVHTRLEAGLSGPVVHHRLGGYCLAVADSDHRPVLEPVDTVPQGDHVTFVIAHGAMGIWVHPQYAAVLEGASP